ncbi:2OG-Fe(II) oxygenase superfamily protein [Kytococcus aerolatus]|uniref:2OG-Fe(II) oxygenase superfamily protein n=1 Tax=Kytococcus aerolatus TaxID=592308 RepID=A0A212T627_9MICO|nr:2OG-Fe(II) oxygenase [Kytococcus aerolatus]SNC61513.1 2OG-Fe(II) oxygenase superfamily protein [Kytococcus aerolatus]
MSAATESTRPTNPDFIEVYPDALSPELCDQIMAAFEASPHQRPGATGGGVNKEMKDSVDIHITGRPEWQALEAQLVQAASRCLVQYVRTYPHTLIAPLVFQHQAPDGTVTRIDEDRIAQMSDQEIIDLAGAALRPGGINIQRYTADSGGYPYWHCETMPKDSSHESLHRHCLWTAYLNDEFEEGATEFLYQDRKVEPKKGALVIAPGAFTHTHRGNRPVGGDKYIATSWFLFHRR